MQSRTLAVVLACAGAASIAAPVGADAQPQAVECPKLEGATMEYGVPAKVRFDSLINSKKGNARTPATFRYVPPYADGFSDGVNFVVDADKGAVTVLWQMSSALREANRRAAPGQPRDDAWSPVTAKIVSYIPGEMLVALANGQGVQGEQVTTYTFFPKLYRVFVTRTTYVRGNTPDAMVTTAQGTCDFSSGG